MRTVFILECICRIGRVRVCVHVFVFAGMLFCPLATESLSWLIIVHQTSALYSLFSLCACPPLTALNIVSVLLVTHIYTNKVHTRTHTLDQLHATSYTSNLAKWGAPGPHKDRLHPPEWIHVGQTNLFSKWFVTWLMFNVLPQIKKGDLVILWQISRRRAWKARGSSFHWT